MGKHTVAGFFSCHRQYSCCSFTWFSRPWHSKCLIKKCCAYKWVKWCRVVKCSQKDMFPIPLRLFSYVMTLHWHKVNVNKMSTLFKLHPTNADDIVLTFAFGNWCILMFQRLRMWSQMLLLQGTANSLGVNTFSHGCSYLYFHIDFQTLTSLIHLN